jgi:hypothetical protein
MKTTFLKISIFLLFIPIFTFADAPGGGLSWHTAFEVTNTKDFKDYTFYYMNWDDSSKIKEGKTYSFKHAGSPDGGWSLYVYARNNQSGKETVAISVGNTDEKSTITIREIRNDSIICDVSTSNYKGETDGSTIPGDGDGNTNNTLTPIQGITPMYFLLIGMCCFAVIIFGLVIFFKSKKFKSA